LIHSLIHQLLVENHRNPIEISTQPPRDRRLPKRRCRETKRNETGIETPSSQTRETANQSTMMSRAARSGRVAGRQRRSWRLAGVLAVTVSLRSCGTTTTALSLSSSSPSPSPHKIAVIGGGASGMFASIAAAEHAAFVHETSKNNKKNNNNSNNSGRAKKNAGRRAGGHGQDPLQGQDLGRGPLQRPARHLQVGADAAGRVSPGKEGAQRIVPQAIHADHGPGLVRDAGRRAQGGGGRAHVSGDGFLPDDHRHAHDSGRGGGGGRSPQANGKERGSRGRERPQ